MDFKMEMSDHFKCDLKPIESFIQSAAVGSADFSFSDKTTQCSIESTDLESWKKYAVEYQFEHIQLVFGSDKDASDFWKECAKLNNL